MANDDDIIKIKRELSRVFGSFFYICSSIDNTEPIYYPLHVSVSRGIDLLEQLDACLEVNHELLH